MHNDDYRKAVLTDLLSVVDALRFPPESLYKWLVYNSMSWLLGVEKIIRQCAEGHGTLNHLTYVWKTIGNTDNWRHLDNILSTVVITFKDAGLEVPSLTPAPVRQPMWWVVPGCSDRPPYAWQLYNELIGSRLVLVARD